MDTLLYGHDPLFHRAFVDTQKQNKYTSNLPASPPRTTFALHMETSLKRIIFPISVLLLACCIQAFADQPQESPAVTNKMLSDSLGWLLGSWDGSGTTNTGREFLGQLSATEELDHSALLLKRESMNKTGGPSGGLKELMVIGFDGTTKKIVGVTYDTNNNISLYVGEMQDKQIVFSSAVAQPGFVSRRTFQLKDDGTVSFFTETGSPGKEVVKAIEINFKKKS